MLSEKLSSFIEVLWHLVYMHSKESNKGSWNKNTENINESILVHIVIDTCAYTDCKTIIQET